MPRSAGGHGGSRLRTSSLKAREVVMLVIRSCKADLGSIGAVVTSRNPKV